MQQSARDDAFREAIKICSKVHAITQAKDSSPFRKIRTKLQRTEPQNADQPRTASLAKQQKWVWGGNRGRRGGKVRKKRRTCTHIGPVPRRRRCLRVSCMTGLDRRVCRRLNARPRADEILRPIRLSVALLAARKSPKQRFPFLASFVAVSSRIFRWS